MKIMTAKEFNIKYQAFLKEGHYGLAVNSPEFVKWLDTKFEEFTKKPNFTYSQIKAKFGYGRFYCEGIDEKDVNEVEQRITDMHSGQPVF